MELNLMEIKAFLEEEWDNAVFSIDYQIKSEMDSEEKSYILNVDEQIYIDYFYNKYYFIPLKIFPETEEFREPLTIVENYYNKEMGRSYERDVYKFTIKYKFEGTAFLFRLKPNRFVNTTYEIDVNENQVMFSFKLYKKDPDEFNRVKTECYNKAFANIQNINSEVEKHNKSLRGRIANIFHNIKEEYLKENSFFEAINLKVKPESKAIFSVPTVKKKVIPQPEISNNKKYTSEPSMSMEIYLDILEVIYSSGKKMERKPSLYKDKDEEGLRDQFLFILEDRYESTTATGETFNKSGKTDILLKYTKDSTNLFIAECKFWKGKSEFHKAINQLFDRYLTWRDSKVALLIFVDNKDFSKVIKSIPIDTKSHSYYVRENGKRGETSFSYIFHLPIDNNKEVFLEIILFHFSG